MELNTIRKSTVLTVLTAVTFQLASSQIAPRATLYDQNDQCGMALTLRDYSFNLGTQYNYNDRARSICIHGIWIFYDGTSFGRDTSGVAYYYNPNSELYCDNLFASISGKVTSVRYWGVAEEKFYADKPTLNFAGKHKSIIITGPSQWTVYEGSNYSGANKCLHSSSGKATIIPDIADIGIRHHSLRSVRKGCWSKAEDIIVLPEAPMSGNSGFLNSTLPV
ncbi:hypothetical protein Ocin01_20080 [Orchesella cincta]|uniref:Uncharacterized protein n=1 Tax=Orchesella cincta TaxID=48709 RepID=A0A1D2M0W4_ORCCI|nr:hypothetical protein Ocin01_20080 [Orchesella cincta]